MKKLLAIILVAVLSVSCEKEIKDPIRIALEEYYEPDRVLLPDIDLGIDLSNDIHSNYRYKSHKVLGIVHYGDEATEYKIEHKYLEDCEFESGAIRDVEHTDTIKVKLFDNLSGFYKINDGFRWKVR